jgi:protein phosphatase
VKVTIPDPALVLLVGPSGAGKSTFAAAHFSPTENVSSDAIRAMLTDDEGDQESSSEAFHVLSLIVNGRLKRRLTTVVDATNLRAANRKGYRGVAARYGVPTVAVAFELPLADYHARNATRRERTVDGFVVDEQAARMVDVVADLRDEGYGSLFVVTGQDDPEVVRLGRGQDGAGAAAS